MTALLPGAIIKFFFFKQSFGAIIIIIIITIITIVNIVIMFCNISY